MSKQDLGTVGYNFSETDHNVFYGVGGQRLDVDVKWQGATLAHMLRVHGKDAHKLGQVVLHVACVVAHRGTNPIQIHYASLLLQVHAASLMNTLVHDLMLQLICLN